MAEQTYRVIFSGALLPGRSAEEVKKNLSAIFRLPPSEVERRFTGKPVVIKNGVDLKTAQKFMAAFERAGAECTIVRMEGGQERRPRPAEGTKAPPGKKPAPKAPAAPAAETEAAPGPSAPESAAPPGPSSAGSGEAARGPRVISPPPRPVSLMFTPLLSSAVTAADGGLNLNRYNCQRVLFSNILLVSVFGVPSGEGPRVRMLLFAADQKKPVVFDMAAVRFGEFPGVREEDEYASLRNFISLLFRNNPSLVIDGDTDTFLAGGSPVTIREEEAARASSLGSALEAEGLFRVRMDETAKALKRAALIAPGRSGSGVKIAVISLIVLVVVGVAVGSVAMLAKWMRETQEEIAKGALAKMPTITAPDGSKIDMAEVAQHPEKAMGMAYDAVAMADLRQACTAAQIFFSEGTAAFLTMDDLRRQGYEPADGVQIQIIDPSARSLRLSGRHVEGSKTFFMNERCRFESR